MELSGWITMIVIMGFVWGGLALILTTALRKESRKQTELDRKEAVR